MPIVLPLDLISLRGSSQRLVNTPSGHLAAAAGIGVNLPSLRSEADGFPMASPWFLGWLTIRELARRSIGYVQIRRCLRLPRNISRIARGTLNRDCIGVSSAM